MTKLKEFLLGAGAIPYIQNELSHGWDLAQLVVQHIPLHTGEIITFLPAQVSPSVIMQFDISIYKSVGENFRNDIENRLADYILAFLEEDTKRYFIIETLWDRRDRSPDIKMPISYFCYNNWVYLFLSHPTETISIKTAFRYGRDYPLIAYLTSLPEAEIQNGKTVSAEIINNLVDNTSQVVIGAYDAEAYLIWSRL